MTTKKVVLIGQFVVIDDELTMACGYFVDYNNHSALFLSGDKIVAVVHRENEKGRLMLRNMIAETCYCSISEGAVTW